MTKEDILSIEENKGDVRYWQPAYPSNFCNQLMVSLVSQHRQEQQRAKEFLDNWPRSQLVDEIPEFFVCPHCGKNTEHFQCDCCFESVFPAMTELQKDIP